MSIASVTTMGYGIGSGFVTDSFTATLGYGLSTTPPVVVVEDTHDGGRKRRDADFRRRNEERKQDVIRAFNRVMGIELPEETPAQEVIAQVEASLFKPKKPREKELLRMARGLQAMLEDGQRAVMEMERARDEEDFIVAMITARSLH